MNTLLRGTLSLLALLLLLPSCSTSNKLQAGMSKEEVTAQFGQPLRVERHRGGSESWFYNSVQKRRVATAHHNASLPGESVYDRDLRLDSQGVSGGIEFSTVENYEERPLRFDANGRLAETPAFDPLPR